MGGDRTEQVRLLPGVFQQAEAMSALGRPEGAAALLERIRPFHPNHPGLLNQLGVALNRSGQPQKTLALLDPLSAADPKAAALRITRSHAHAQLGNQEAALSEAREAIHLAPRLAQSHLALANAHLAAEQDSEALWLSKRLHAAILPTPRSCSRRPPSGGVICMKARPQWPC